MADEMNARTKALNHAVAVSHVIWNVVYKQTGFLSESDLCRMAEAFWPLRSLCAKIMTRVTREDLSIHRRFRTVPGPWWLKQCDPKKYAAAVRAQRRKRADRPKATRNGASAYSRKRNLINVFEHMLHPLDQAGAIEMAMWYATKHHIDRIPLSATWWDIVIRHGVSTQFVQTLRTLWADR